MKIVRFVLCSVGAFFLTLIGIFSFLLGMGFEKGPYFFAAQSSDPWFLRVTKVILDGVFTIDIKVAFIVLAVICFSHIKVVWRLKFRPA